MSKLSNLKPERVFYYFEEISKIPRGSGNTEAISEYLKQFSIEHNLKYVKEDIGNVIIYKPASNGYEDSDTIILQGHMDMVCEKNSDSDHDFVNDGIELVIDGEYVRANKTTLGADDGIAIAYMLAILEDDSVKHPPLEAVITVDEETGMDGAIALDVSNLKGKKIINIDSEEEGILWASCAGGVRCECRLPLEYENNMSDSGILIKISGLSGGHSGTEINKNRLNSNCLLGQLLVVAARVCDFKIAEIGGGMKDNAIPREAFAIIHADKSSVKEVISCLEKISSSIIEDNKSREPGISITIEETKALDKHFSAPCSGNIIFLLNALPNGVVAMSADIENLVETSLNIGVMSVKEDCFVLDLSLRSSVGSQKARLKERVKYITEHAGGICNVSGDYPAWEYRKTSILRNVFSEQFKEMYGKDMQILALHAGLECGILTDKIEDCDCVSIGPDIFEIHTPNEKMNILSVERTYNLLLKVLEKLK